MFSTHLAVRSTDSLRLAGAVGLWVLLTLALGSPWALAEDGSGDEAPPVPVLIRLEPAGSIDPQESLPIEMEVARRGAEIRQTFAATLPGELRVSLGTGPWLLRVLTPDLWSPALEVDVAEPETEVSMSLWPAGTVKAPLVFPEGEEAPEHLQVHFQRSPRKGDRRHRGPESSQLPPSTVLCPIRGLIVSCTIPAVTLDLRLGTENLVDLYFFDVPVVPGRTRVLPKTEFQKGAAIAGWVSTDDRSVSAEGAGVRIWNRGMAGPSVRDAERRDLKTLRTSVNARGFFLLTGVPAGEYFLEVSKEPFASVTVSVRVAEDRTTTVDDPPLLLQRPQPFAIIVDPPAGPWDTPWQLDVVQIDRGYSTIAEVYSGRMGLDGQWRSEGLSPGRYKVSVGPRSEESWHWELVTIDGSVDFLHIDLPTVAIAGEIMIGDAPLAADLWFGGKFATPSAHLVSGAEGDFEGILPEPSEDQETQGARVAWRRSGEAIFWQVEVVSRADGTTWLLDGVEVRKRPGRDTARVVIEIPDTLLQGRVVDRERKPLEKAQVLARSLKEPVFPVQATTGADGTFQIRGLPRGPASVGAQFFTGDKSLASPDVTVSLLSEQRQEPSPVVLVVDEGAQVRGRIVGPGGPVQGARVKADSLQDSSLWQAQATSDVEGRFELQLLPETREFLLSVSPPGFSFRMLRFRLEQAREPLVIPVSGGGGTLHVELPENLDWRQPGDRGIWVFHESAMEFLGYLASWVARNDVPLEGSRMTIPQMEAGSYRICVGDRNLRLQALAGVLAGAVCSEGYLAPGGELALVLDQSREVQGGR